MNLNQEKRCPIAGDLACEDCRHYTAVSRSTVTDTGKEVTKMMWVCPTVENMLLLEQIVRQTYGTTRAVEDFRNRTDQGLEAVGGSLLALADSQERLALSHKSPPLKQVKSSG